MTGEVVHVPYLALPLSTRRRDRLVAHPELMLGPGWLVTGVYGMTHAWSVLLPWVQWVALVTSLCVAVGGALLLSSVLLVPRIDERDGRQHRVPLSTIWMLERAGWIVGAVPGWLAYAAVVAYSSLLIPTLAATFLGLAVLRLWALERLEESVRASASRNATTTEG